MGPGPGAPVVPDRSLTGGDEGAEPFCRLPGTAPPIPMTLSPERVKNYLDGLHFPLTKDEVVARLDTQIDLKDEERRLVHRLPDITYRRPNDVVHGLDFARTKAPYTRSSGPEPASAEDTTR